MIYCELILILIAKLFEPDCKVSFFIDVIDNEASGLLDQIVRFDLEDYARADIARLGEEIRSVWEASEPSRAEPEEAEATKEQLQRLAKGRGAQRQG